MEGRAIAFAKKIEANKIDVTGNDNIYLAALKKLYVNFKSPTPEQALLAVMQEYLNKGEGYISQYTLHHKQTASDIKSMLEKKQWNDALTHLDTVKDLTLAGDFALALATYFNFFPSTMGAKLKPVFEKSLGQNIWQSSTNERLMQFMTNHKNGIGNNDHEQLEQIASSVPKEMADQFADFLLGELDNDKRPKNTRRTDFERSGLYAGWVCVGLGKLASQLSEQKKLQVCERLKLILRSKQHDRRLIGAVIAISKMTKDGDLLGEAANTIHEYTKSNLLFLKDDFSSDNATVATYLPKLFAILFDFESHYKQEKRDELIRLVTGPHDLFALRAGIHTLHSWMQDAEREALLTTLQAQPKFEVLFPYFFSWLNTIKCGDKLSDKYYQTLKNLMNEFQDEDFRTTYSEHLACIATDTTLKPEAKRKIISLLSVKIEESCLDHAFQPEQKSNLYKAPSMITDWLKDYPPQSEQLLNTLIGALGHHNNHDHGLRAKIMATIFTFIPFRSFDSSKLRDELLEVLSKDADEY
jgi:hypothetical protein